MKLGGSSSVLIFTVARHWISDILIVHIVTGDSVGCSGHVVNGRSMERFERSWPVELSGTGSGKRLHCRLSLKH